ncbi:type II secretion system F family protein [Rhodopirellula sallentina]|uniref:General secretion pathway protein F-putative pilus protein n=1 Tax=Rhodopirellula sallentina SM41 TaxID=1263870 RepID=M5TWE3_9BACT|nr:type II secretion system F family protein [Rhodopirellula sallentina]EMI53495.1 general secretion pathway protein F-putative pilus protein [Rhodopirellula sallentina SM41]
MLWTRIENETLSTLCERVGVAFEVGLDPHRVFEREAKGSATTYGRRMRSVAEQIREGTALSDAVKAQGNYFPPHFAEMIEGGERSGKLDRVLDRLSEYYRQLAEFRSIFFQSIMWPIVQLVLAICVVGALIYLPSVLLPDADADRHDLIGIGLVGERGLMIYLSIVSLCAAAVFLLYVLATNGFLRFIPEWIARLPWIGHNLRVFAEARFVQTLAITIESGVDAAAAVSLAFRSAGTSLFTSKAEPCKHAIMQGQDMHTVLADTHLFGEETLEVIELGEASGKLAESLDKHFNHLKSKVRKSMAQLTYVASALIWFLIAAALITIIFRVFSMYVDGLGNRASDVMRGDAGF